MIDPDDIDQELEQHHRDAMLNLILAWGSLDGALGMMLARVLGITMIEGAEIVAKMPASARFAEMRRLMLRASAGESVARMLKKHKKSYERHSQTRNFIAHSHCAGIWTKDRDYVVFATYEKVGPDELAVDAVPIQEMHKATAWGGAMCKLALAIADVPYAEETNTSNDVAPVPNEA